VLYTVTGFGFAVLRRRSFLLFVDPPRAIQLVIIISTALSFVALPGLWRAIAPGLLMRLGLGSLAGLPLGLVAFRYADPVVVRALVGATILAFAALLGWRRRRGAGEFPGPFGMKSGIENRDQADRRCRQRDRWDSGTASADLPVARRGFVANGAVDPTLVLRVRLCSEPCFPRRDRRHPHRNVAFSGILIPFAFLGALAERPLGDRVGADAFAILAILLLTAAGLCTLAAAAAIAVR
jgi:uncharacterized membrane protein YfcA